MRIANIPPDMWVTAPMQAAAPEVIYVGPAPSGDSATREFSRLFPHASHPSRAAFVYIFLHCDASAVYVGKTRNPVARFAKHRRREWWSEVYNLVLLRVEGQSERDADALALHVEALLIQRLSPSWNIAGIDGRPMWRRGVFA